MRGGGEKVNGSIYITPQHRHLLQSYMTLRSSVLTSSSPAFTVLSRSTRALRSWLSCWYCCKLKAVAAAAAAVMVEDGGEASSPSRSCSRSSCCEVGEGVTLSDPEDEDEDEDVDGGDTYRARN